MNGSEEWHTDFSPAEAGRLGREAGLGPAEAERVLREGLPLLRAALADHARTPEGERRIAEAVQNLPRFTSVEAALGGPGGAAALLRAGQLLGPALLGPRAEAIARRVTGTANPAAVGHLLHLALPLVLSLPGARGMLAGQPVEGTATDHVTPSADGARLVVSAVPGAPYLSDPAPGPQGPARGGLSAQDLIGGLRAELGGDTAARLGTLAGFGGASAARATLAALPVVLGAIARKGRSEAAAGVLLARGSDFERLMDAGGALNPHLLDDPARVAQIEGQGRGLLGPLLGNPDGVRARLGAALGGPGESAGRLLALLTPLVLGLLVRRARAGGLDARRLSALLGGLGPHLPALLPADLSGLGSLLNPDTGEASVSPETTAAPPRPAAPSPAPARRRRRGGPWWLIPVLLLLLGGGYFLWSRPAPTPALGAAGAVGEGITVSSPAPGADLPLGDLTLRGTGRPGDTLTVEDGGLEVASTRVGADSTWQVTLPEPTLGEHAYTVRGSGDTTSGELRVNVTAGVSSETTADPGESPEAPLATGPTAPPSEAFAIAEPALGAQLPAGSFTLRGSGTPGDSLQILEDDTSLGSVTVGGDGAWSLNVPSPSPGPHTYAVYAQDATELGRVDVTVDDFGALPAAGGCDREYTLSITDGQTVREPFRFGGAGQGEGYRVTVLRAGRVVGNQDILLDPSCGWSYQSRPGAGTVTYEVRPIGAPGAEPLSVVNLTVRP
ncbi:hypothetical protein DAETH_08530 [Deinococcus aetherius]|uniref:Uncharacterized protein n=1 Tax=Deinococcus aetherius TaxID=200252 RepID=A0ABN6RE23_9DEIO|nr:DUF937 domain-containing protein [Deinococcus aetherius]BDP40884.1 hypothetical protein DAETH_08530 [Deinococcus aetherius]